MTIQAIYENGVFRPLDAVSLPDHCKVEISIVATRPASGHPALQRLLDIANRYPINPDAPIDGAEQHDHYLYGTPKRS